MGSVQVAVIAGDDSRSLTRSFLLQQYRPRVVGKARSNGVGPRLQQRIFRHRQLDDEALIAFDEERWSSHRAYPASRSSIQPRDRLPHRRGI